MSSTNADAAIVGALETLRNEAAYNPLALAYLDRLRDQCADFAEVAPDATTHFEVVGVMQALAMAEGIALACEERTEVRA